MINIAEVLILHIVLPITLLVMTPVYYQVTPAFFNMHIPDYYAALVLVSVVLVFSGIIKAVFMIGKRI